MKQDSGILRPAAIIPTAAISVALMLIGVLVSSFVGHAIGIGLTSYTITKSFCGKTRDVFGLTYIISVPFLVKFFLAV